MYIKRISTLLILMIAFSAIALAKNSYATVEGDWNFKQFNFEKAAKYYEKALKRDKENVYLIQRIADSYRLMNNWSAAEGYYGRLANSGNATAANTLYYAEALRTLQKYPDAKIYYAKYLETYPSDSSVKERMRGMDMIPELSKVNELYEVKNQDSINTKYLEFGVAIHGNDEVYFNSDRQPKAYVRREDNWTTGTFMALYQAEVKDTLGNLKKATLIESNSINKKFHQSSPSYNEQLSELYFDRSNFNAGRARFSDDKTVKLKIYKVQWSPQSKSWNGELKEAIPFNDKEFSACHPTLTKSGDTLYFTSDMPGGYGRTDIYRSTRVDRGQWGEPVNLGEGVNTSGDDMFPFIANDGTLYFASNGHMGLGGLDIYSSTNETGTWTTPKNVGAPINTNADDFGYVLRGEGKSGYFVSNRTGGAGGDDIYSFTLKGIMLKGVTYNGYTGALIADATVDVKPTVVPAQMITGKDGDFTCSATPNTDYIFNATKEGYLPAQLAYRMTDAPGEVRIPMYPVGNIMLEVTVIDKQTRLPIDRSEVKIKNLHLANQLVLTTDSAGKCLIGVDSVTRYSIEAAKQTYFNASAEVSTTGFYPPAVIRQLLELDKTAGVIVLKNIYYDLDKWAIRPDAAVELDRLVRILKDNPAINIELGSHTDCRETQRYNMTLSEKRAQSAVNYMVTRGINIRRMTAAGYGESKLVNDCRCEGDLVSTCSEEEHQQNRRTEFKVVQTLITNRFDK
jgi:outer membrane protein OmpA-like peptidoglycan-associated protein/tetratricopeptide (TPR) repeat protein